MGQRLNLELCYGGETLASGYYHWGAYSKDACELAVDVLHALEESSEALPVMKAIEALEYTGAGIPEDAIDAIKNEIGLDLSGRQEMKSRNDGIIEVCKTDIEAVRHWSEGNVVVDIEDTTVSFGVMWEMTYDEFVDNEMDENDVDAEEANSEYLKLKEVHFDFDKMYISDLLELLSVMDEIMGNSNRVRNNGNVIEFIG